MFSLKTLHVRFRRLLPALVGTAVLVMAVEIAFRWKHWFYDYGGWESPGLQKKMERGDELFNQEGHLDLVTLSTSIGRVLDVTQWEDATSDTLVAYNYGFPDQRPERQNFLFQNYIYPRYKPKYVIYGLSLVDCNANVRAMDPRHPRKGPFWTYRNVSALSADTLPQKVVAGMDEISYLFRARHRARFTLQYGDIAMLPEDPTVGNGILAPTIRRQPFGPMVKSWALDPAGMKYNVYHDYWIPDEGEIGQVIELGKFCQKHGIKFAVVEFPGSPYGHTNWDNGISEYWKFTNALDFIASKGIPVFPMARDLEFDNTHFEDQEHMNRWGGQMSTDYVYEKVVRPWLGDDLPEKLHHPQELHLSDIVEATSASLSPQDKERISVGPAKPVPNETMYESTMQVLLEPGADLTIPVRTSSPLTSATYMIELYAGDGSTTTPELMGKAHIRLQGGATGERATTANTTLNLKWVHIPKGLSYSRAYYNVPANATLELGIHNPSNQPVVLDSLFIRPRFTAAKNQSVID